jgi:hypothetical protein
MVGMRTERTRHEDTEQKEDRLGKGKSVLPGPKNGFWKGVS